jgi:hypothetical protein
MLQLVSDHTTNVVPFSVAKTERPSIAVLSAPQSLVDS